jgi:hypothetical protein
MHSRYLKYFRAGPAISRAIESQNMRKLFLGVSIAGVAVLIFAMTLQTLLAAAQERRVSAAASIVHVKPHD